MKAESQRILSGPHDIFNQLRYELKMVSDAQSLSKIKQWVRLHPAGFKVAYPARCVNNIYFDTFGNDSFLDHVNGVNRRRKLRFRWYGSSFEEVQGHLEVKQKINRLGGKLNLPVEKSFSLLSTDWKSICAIFFEETNGVIREMLSVSKPVLINRYDRDYFVTADKRIRLTLDYKHTVYDQRFLTIPNLKYKQPVLDKVIIEVKTDVKNSDDLADILSRFPLRITQNSKFLDSMESILG